MCHPEGGPRTGPGYRGHVGAEGELSVPCVNAAKIQASRPLLPVYCRNPSPEPVAMPRRGQLNPDVRLALDTARYGREAMLRWWWRNHRDAPIPSCLLPAGNKTLDQHPPR
jgi:hypothetical protein